VADRNNGQDHVDGLRLCWLCSLVDLGRRDVFSIIVSRSVICVLVVRRHIVVYVICLNVTPTSNHAVDHIYSYVHLSTSKQAIT
jgi:hypothetical protein